MQALDFKRMLTELGIPVDFVMSQAGDENLTVFLGPGSLGAAAVSAARDQVSALAIVSRAEVSTSGTSPEVILRPGIS